MNLVYHFILQFYGGLGRGLGRGGRMPGEKPGRFVLLLYVFIPSKSMAGLGF